MKFRIKSLDHQKATSEHKKNQSHSSPISKNNIPEYQKELLESLLRMNKKYRERNNIISQPTSNFRPFFQKKSNKPKKVAYRSVQLKRSKRAPKIAHKNLPKSMNKNYIEKKTAFGASQILKKVNLKQRKPNSLPPLKKESYSHELKVLNKFNLPVRPHTPQNILGYPDISNSSFSSFRKPRNLSYNNKDLESSFRRRSILQYKDGDGITRSKFRPLNLLDGDGFQFKSKFSKNRREN